MNTVLQAPSSDRVKAEAFALGFDLAGIATLGPAETISAFDSWLEEGYAGEMSYLARGSQSRRDSRTPARGACSGIVVAMNYGGTQPSGTIARYARGDDYHDVVGEKLEELHQWLNAACEREIPGKAYVDTGPLLERDLAKRAGLGWFGKNTNLINPKLGSFFFLGVLLVDLELEPDPPFEADRCGTCRRCLDACPTQAFAAPRVLDARRCISYLTIELRDAIPEALRPQMGELIFGCDICQDVCPWNVRFSRDVAESRLAPRFENIVPDPRTILSLTEEQFRVRYRGSPVKRAKRRGLVRNAAVALGNRADPSDVPVLARALSDSEPLVRMHAAWALGRIGSDDAHEALRGRRVVEHDAAVIAELESAMVSRV